MNSRAERLRRILTASLLALAACGREPAAPEPEGARTPEVLVRIAPRVGNVGDTITLAVELPPDGVGYPVMALQGRVRFDAERLRYIGQPVTSHLVMVGSAEAGEVVWLALAERALPTQVAQLAFEVIRGGASPPTLTFDELVDAKARPRARPSPRVRLDDALPPVRAPRRLDAEDWLDLLGLREPPTRWAAVAGDGVIYGDANLNGIVTGADYVAIANVAVGNLPLLTLENRDFAIAANVAPANLPGLGEVGDPVPPGRNPDGSFTITASDAALVANRAVGLPVAVVGEPIPGRGPRSARAVLADTIAASRVLSRDTVYELRGKVVVGHPDTPDVTLTIEAGTRIEGDPATRAQLIIRRGANLIAVGTRLQPIVFSCRSDAPAAGCWGGLVVNGFGVLNNGSSTGGGGVGFPTKEGLGGSGRYGGNLPEDSSGVLRYVRIEFAGAPPVNAAERLPGLQLLGVGSRTVIDSIQVHSAGGDGVLVSGGTVALRAVVVSDAGRDGLVWRDGWQGAGQSLVLQQGPGSRHALHGLNDESAPDALPRSAPILSHVTVIGTASPTPDSRGLLLEHGSAGEFANGVLLRSGAVAFDVQGAASCALLGVSIVLRSSIVFSAPGEDAALDGDCADEPAELDAPARENRRVDPGLVSPFTTRAPDWRPAAGAAAASGARPVSQPPYPPAFFTAVGDHVGATPPGNLLGSNVPWYAGWTRTF